MKKQFYAIAIAAVPFIGLGQTKSIEKPIIKANEKTEVRNPNFQIDLSARKIDQLNLERTLKDVFGLDENNELQFVKKRTDDLGITHTNFQHYYKQLPIEGGTVMMHEKNGIVKYTNGFLLNCDGIETTPVINSNQALIKAKNQLDATTLIQEYPIELVIVPVTINGNKVGRMAHKVRIDKLEPFTMCNVYVDAISGEVLKKTNLMAHGDVPGTAQTLYSGTQNITSDSFAGSFRLRDNARGIETYNAAPGTTFNGTGFDGAVDYTNTTANWGQVPKLNTLTVSAISTSWWYNASTDPIVDLFITIEDADGMEVYKSATKNNQSPAVTFTNLNLFFLNGPYTVKLWDEQASGTHNLGGTYNIVSTVGTQAFSGNGNSGTYSVISTGNPGLDVHWGMEKTVDYYMSKFSRDSYDGAGGLIRQYVDAPFLQVRQGESPNNASAYGSPYNIMVYGMGNGSYLGPVVGLDVEGHEFTHLVVSNNGNGGLDYEAESGALNESFADIFGASIEFSAGSTPDWLIGEDVGVSIPYFRSMSNPNIRNHPDTYHGTYWVNTDDVSNTNDYGGVHSNSGVQNFWYYLLVTGGSGTNDNGDSYSVTGIGIAKAEQIAYRNLTNYLTSSSTFNDAYAGSLQAAEDLYGAGSPEYAAVEDAWFAVGIPTATSSYCSGTVTLTAPSGTFDDGSGTGDYLNNSTCSWLIQPSGVDYISLDITQLGTESGYDFVRVYDGSNASATLLYSASGTTLPATITSSGGTMFVQFSSDGLITGTGFTAQYTSGVNGTGSPCTGTTVLTTPSGTFDDGSGGSNYQNYSTCSWRISPPGATSITLSFSSFSTESGYDYVRVYNGTSATGTPVLTASGSSIPSSVTITGGNMFVQFTTDGSQTYQGWTANYTSGTGSAGCNPTSTVCQNFIQNVTFNTLNNTSACDNYRSFTNTTTVTKGQTYSMRITPQIGTTVGSAYTDDEIVAWIDWNNDGDFYDSGEQAAYVLVTTGWSNLFSVTIPSTAVTGTVAMRVRISNLGADGATNPCFVSTYGEVEDYSITIAPSGPVAPVANFTASATNICAGQTVTYTNTSTGSPTSYSWSFPGGTPATSTQASPTVTYNTAGVHNVTLTATNSVGSDGETKTAYITVKSKPGTPTAGGTTPVCQGETINLTSTTVAGATYTWTGPDAFSSTAKDPVIPNATLAKAGTYTLYATLNGCNSLNSTIAIAVKPTPNAVAATSNSPLCSGETIQLTSGTISGVTYQWTGPNSFTSTTKNPAIPNCSVANAGVYELKTVLNGCSSQPSTVTVVVNQVPTTPVITSNAPVCNGSDLTMNTDAVSGATYNWSGPDGFTSTANTNTIPAVTAIKAGSYTLSISKAGCTSPLATKVVSVKPTPDAPVASSNGSICEGKEIFLSATSPFSGSYEWIGPNSFTSTLQNPTVTNAPEANEGTYGVTITVNGCKSPSATTTVVINPSPALPVITSNSPVCSGQTLTLSTPAVSGATYEWTGASPLTSTENQSIPNAQLSNAGTYNLVVKVNGCSSPVAEHVVVVTETPLPPVLSSNSPICSGLALQLNATLPTSGNVNWTGPNFTSNEQNPFRPDATADMSGVYSVTVSNGACVSQNSFINIIVNQTPAVNLTGQPTTGCPPLTVTFFGASPTGANQWIFGNGNTSTTNSVATEVYNQSGCFHVTLTITENGCVGSKTIQNMVCVDPCIGLKELQENTVLIYPNPSSGKFTLDANESKIEQIQLLDNAGRLISIINYSGVSKIEQNFENLANGHYTIVVTTNEVIERIPIVIQK